MDIELEGNILNQRDSFVYLGAVCGDGKTERDSTPVRNGNLGSDRTTTQAASVRKQLGPKNSKSNESRQAKNGGVKGRDGSVEELDRETDEEQITVGWTRRKDGR